MTSLKPRSIFALLLVFSWLRATRLEVANTVKIACMNKVLDLLCPVQGPSSDFFWKYKENHTVDWQEIGFFSKNITSLSSNLPPKFKDNIKVFSDGSLTISSLTRELSGIYNCQLDNEGKVLHNMFKVVAVNCEKAVCEGDDAIIECDLLKYINLFPGLNQPTELQWKNKETTLVVMVPNMNVTYQNPNFSNIGPMQGDGGLRIWSARKDINGEQYTCVLHGEKGVTSRRYSVAINVQTCQNKTREACEGQSIDLQCPYYLMQAISTKNIWIEWYNESNKIAILRKNQGHAIPSESSLVKINETNGMVTLMSLGMFDNGAYRCKVFRDTMLLADHSVTLNVKQCPSLTGYQMPNKAGSQDSKENKEAKPKADKDVDMCVLVSFAVFVIFVLPICLYRMVKKRRQIPDHPPEILI